MCSSPFFAATHHGLEFLARQNIARKQQQPLGTRRDSRMHLSDPKLRCKDQDPMRGEVVQWVFGEFIPFGDLVSDVALVVTLPHRDEVENSLLEEHSLYRVMRWLLWVGTVVSLIPEIALFIGICTCLVIGIFLGPATWSTGGIGQGVLNSNFEQMKIFAR